MTTVLTVVLGGLAVVEVSAGSSRPQQAAAASHVASPVRCSAPGNDCSPRDESLAAKPALSNVLVPSNPAPVDAAQAMAMVARDTSEFPAIIRMSATQSTWAGFWQDDTVAAPGPAQMAALPASEPLWLVAVSGTIVPGYQVSGPQSDTEAVVAVDANTGLILSVSAGRGADGAFPPAFVALVAAALPWPAA